MVIPNTYIYIITYIYIYTHTHISLSLYIWSDTMVIHGDSRLQGPTPRGHCPCRSEAIFHKLPAEVEDCLLAISKRCRRGQCDMYIAKTI